MQELSTARPRLEAHDPERQRRCNQSQLFCCIMGGFFRSLSFLRCPLRSLRLPRITLNRLAATCFQEMMRKQERLEESGDGNRKCGRCGFEAPVRNLGCEKVCRHVEEHGQKEKRGGEPNVPRIAAFYHQCHWKEQAGERNPNHCECEPRAGRYSVHGWFGIVAERLTSIAHPSPHSPSPERLQSCV
jgi:hypothetical protein